VANELRWQLSIFISSLQRDHFRKKSSLSLAQENIQAGISPREQEMPLSKRKRLNSSKKDFELNL
jgi:hypothetical protein